MINNKLNLAIVALVLYLGCTPAEDNDIPPESVDTTPPSISLSGIGERIERFTSLTITISDKAQSVTTTLSINGKEVLNTTQKQFTFEIDPFHYPSGEMSLTILSSDQGKNQSTETYNFQLNKLLYRQNFGFSSESVESYVAINASESGELIDFRKMNGPEDASFYASDDFQKKELVITQYSLGKNSNAYLARSYAGVSPGTIRMNFNEVKQALGLEHNITNQTDQLQLTIENVPFFNGLSTLGHDYSFGMADNPNLIINCDRENTPDVFVMYHTNDNPDILEDYRYLRIDNLTDKSLDFSDMGQLSAENINTVTLPESVEKFSFNLYGYDNQEAYREGYFRLIYGYGSETQNSGFSFQYPEIEEYSVLEKIFVLNLKDGREVQLDKLDVSNVEIPELSVQQSDGTINIFGEYDFSALSLHMIIPDGGNNSIFNRSYQDTYKSTLKNPFEKLEIPLIIVEFLRNKGFDIDPIETSGEMNLLLTQYQNNIDYPDGVFYYEVGNETGDKTKVRFPLEN